MRGILKSRVAAVVTGAAVLAVAAGTSGAVASSLIGTRQIRDNSVRSVDIHDGSLGYRDMNLRVKNMLTEGRQLGPAGPQGPQGVPGPAGPAGPAGQDAGLAVNYAGSPTVVKNIGGKFSDQKTAIGSFDLQPGTYVINAEGFFESTDATSGASQLELALRSADGSVTTTCFTGETSPTAGRDASCTATQAVTITGATTVTLYAFGYQDDHGSADSGSWVAVGTANAIQVK